MTIELQGHVQAVEYGGRGDGRPLRATLTLEMSRANGQKLEISMTEDEARAYLPGTPITLRFWPIAPQSDGELIMARTAQQKLIDLLWELTDDSEVHARTGDVLLTLQRQQATEMYKLFWRLGGKYREGLKEVGWSPPPRGRCGPADDPNAPFRWICIHCDTVSGIDDQACLGCKKPRYPALATASGEVKS
jgi:hypothetical protein